ncbi:hypothetical protein CDAR_94081 [Caerostris darwini]|uniref:Uncharacterized protein n=1 Tax=Caerostris darwini TaxID=1538125 RepID=A0AAV4NJX4_9ARAC|nr:hypothetical protein CDAR_94081 [Caerostris darwini]
MKTEFPVIALPRVADFVPSRLRGDASAASRSNCPDAAFVFPTRKSRRRFLPRKRAEKRVHFFPSVRADGGTVISRAHKFGWNVLLPSFSNNNVLLLFPRDAEESSLRAPIFTTSRNLSNGRSFSFR